MSLAAKIEPMSAKGDGDSDWRPRGNWLHFRADCTEQLRQFFRRRQVLEVRTPCLSQFAATAPHLSSFAAGDHWLRTSPEHHMKRLLAAGSGDIWQLGPCFRADEAGRLHNPEFEMLEWYRVGMSLAEMQAETRELIASFLPPTDWRILSCREFMSAEWGLDPWVDAAASFRQRALQAGAPQFADGLDVAPDSCAPWLDFLLQQRIEDKYSDCGLVISGWPPEQAELSAVRQSDGCLQAQRFEIWVNGVELANGAEELGCADEAQRRMEAENAMRSEPMPADRCLLAALRQGLPDCCGTAVGFDRLLMLAAAETQLPLEFPVSCA